ncbi:ABC transporter permease, partial [Klebsiella pneumoniae]
KIGPDPRNFNQRVSLGRNDLLIRTFLSMPDWAKAIGSCLPLTYFIRLVKGIMLKGYSATALLPDLLPLIGLAVIVIGVGLKSYRKTLD